MQYFLKDSYNMKRYQNDIEKMMTRMFIAGILVAIFVEPAIFFLAVAFVLVMLVVFIPFYFLSKNTMKKLWRIVFGIILTPMFVLYLFVWLIEKTLQSFIYMLSILNEIICRGFEWSLVTVWIKTYFKDWFDSPTNDLLAFLDEFKK